MLKLLNEWKIWYKLKKQFRCLKLWELKVANHYIKINSDFGLILRYFFICILFLNFVKRCKIRNTSYFSIEWEGTHTDSHSSKRHAFIAQTLYPIIIQRQSITLCSVLSVSLEANTSLEKVKPKIKTHIM